VAFGRLSANASRGPATLSTLDAGYCRPQRAASCGREKFAHDNKVDLRSIELDGVFRKSPSKRRSARLSPNRAGSMSSCTMLGTWSSDRRRRFTPEQLAELYDINVLSTQRVKPRSAAPNEKQQQGFSSGVFSSSSAGGTPPYLAPYFASKAGMGRNGGTVCARTGAVGIEKPRSSFPAHHRRDNHFAHSGTPADKQRAPSMKRVPTKAMKRKIQEAFAAIVPPDADAGAWRRQSLKSWTPVWQTPVPRHIDPTQDGRTCICR